jgi:hypothetical protein
MIFKCTLYVGVDGTPNIEELKKYLEEAIILDLDEETCGNLIHPVISVQIDWNSLEDSAEVEQ